ncbi:putative uncharacterized protein [Ligilactobacillus ruminis CAG:367]|nr:putative uncharacterized protein [Ligilactobacillus ruminis CAG:367]
MKIMISPADDEEEEIIIKCSALTADLLAGSHFDKCSTRSISTSRSYYGQSAVLELFVRKNKQKLAAIAHPGPRGGKSRQKPSKMSEICLPTRSKSALAEAKVDKD